MSIEDRSIEAQCLRDKWMPRIHSCLAYAICFFYLTFRERTESFPKELNVIWQSPIVILISRVTTIVSIAAALGMKAYLKKKIYGQVMNFSIFEIEKSKLKYEIPFLIALAFIVVIELIIFFDSK